jgi:hypothetical protein
MKTFWDWQDQQLPDGTIIWRFPDGQTYITTPGSALLFPRLCAPTGDPPATPKAERCGERTAMMPLRTTTRAQNRARYVAEERVRNRKLRAPHRQVSEAAYFGGPAPPGDNDDDDPPPF